MRPGGLPSRRKSEEQSRQSYQPRFKRLVKISTIISALKYKRERLQSKIEEAGYDFCMTLLNDRAEVEESIVSANGQLTRLQEGIARAERPVVSLDEGLTEKDGLLLETLERIAGKEIEVQFQL